MNSYTSFLFSGQPCMTNRQTESWMVKSVHCRQRYYDMFSLILGQPFWLPNALYLLWLMSVCWIDNIIFHRSSQWVHNLIIGVLDFQWDRDILKYGSMIAENEQFLACTLLLTIFVISHGFSHRSCLENLHKKRFLVLNILNNKFSVYYGWCCIYVS